MSESTSRGAEEGAADAGGGVAAKPSRRERSRSKWGGGWVTSIGVSTGIVLVMLFAALTDDLPALRGVPGQLYPFLLALTGTALYVMRSVRTRRERFNADYWPDYAFRCAQACVYLYIILAILAQTRDAPDLVNYAFTGWSPNLIGLLVGLYILQVEKAMDGFGDRFGEALGAVLGRALTARTARDRQREQVHGEGRLAEIKAQLEALTAVLYDPAQTAALNARVTEIERAFRDEDVESAQERLTALVNDMELLKRAQREQHRVAWEVGTADSRGSP
jgi:hypothetical protein